MRCEMATGLPMKANTPSEQCVWTLETGPSWYLKSGCGRRGGDVGALNTGGWKVCPYCGKEYAYAGRARKDIVRKAYSDPKGGPEYDAP